MGLTTAPSPTTRVCAVYVAVADSLFRAANPVLTSTRIVVGPLLHGVPGEAVAAAEVAHDLEGTALQLDAELVDGPLARGRGTLAVQMTGDPT